MVKPDITVTNIPLTAESRETLLEKLFSEELPHPGEVFIPDDSFYLANVNTKKRAKHMVTSLCRWLGIKPGYIGLEFETGHGETADGTRHTIYIESFLLKDEFMLGAFLAYALTHYLVEERKQIRLTDTNQQEALLANASVMFGLGITVLNGLRSQHNWLKRIRGSQPVLLKSFPYITYLQLTRNYLRKYRIEPAMYNHSLVPWAAKGLGIDRSVRPTHAIRDIKHQIKVINIKLIGVGWILLLVLGIGGYTLLQRVSPISNNVREAEEKTVLLHNLVRLCNDELAYNRQYADHSDIQTMRALNAEELHCQSLKSQYDAANQEYQKLLSP